MMFYALFGHTCEHFSVTVNAILFQMRNRTLQMCYHCNTCLCLTHVTVIYSNFTIITDLVLCLLI